MAQAQEELEQMATWFSEEGLAPDSPKEAQLGLLWHSYQHTRSHLSRLTRDLDIQRSQHLAEMAEVRKSLEQIRIFTEHKDVLAQEIQDENEQLKDQLQRLISLQDAQVSVVAKMLYQQGLTELIYSSCSEQVAYLLVERASLLDMSDIPAELTCDGKQTNSPGAERQVTSSNACQSSLKGAPRSGQSPWKRLFGLHKASQSKSLLPAKARELCMAEEIQEATTQMHLDPVHFKTEARHVTGQANTVEREFFRLERDLEEGSRRLAMAHSEIRHLTEQLESAHLTQRAYEPELQAAQQEVEQLRQEVEKVKKYEIVELRKTKEMNDRLDLEIRALRNRVRSLDAEKTSLQQLVVCLQKEVEQRESALQEQQQQLPTMQVQLRATELAQINTTYRNIRENLTSQTRRFLEKEETVACLQREVEQLELALQEQQQQAEQQLQAVQIQAKQANEFAESWKTELNQSQRACRDLQNNLSAQTRCLLEKESEIVRLKQNLDNSHKHLDNLTATTCIKENNPQDQKLGRPKEADSPYCEKTHRQLKDSFTAGDEEQKTQECPDDQEAVRAVLFPQDECEALKQEICESLKCLDTERSKYHEMKEKHKAKLCRAKQKFDDETTWRDEKIKSLERELSLSCHSLAKEKELVVHISVENEKLLVERRKLLQHLNEEEDSKKELNLAASLSKSRVDFLETENKKLGNKILHLSNQLAVLEHTLQNVQSLHSAEELKKVYNPQHFFSFLSLQTSSVRMPDLSETLTLLDDTQSSHTKHTELTSSPNTCSSAGLSRSAEVGYLNLTSTQSNTSSPAALSSSGSTVCVSEIFCPSAT